MAILSILSGQGSLVGMERFVKRHRQSLNVLFRANSGKTSSDSTFRLLLAPLDLATFLSLIRNWMTAKPGITDLASLVCNGKTLSGSIAETNSGAGRFICQVSFSITAGISALTDIIRGLLRLLGWRECGKAGYS